MSQCLRGLQKMDSVLLLCFAFLQQSLAKSDKWILVNASCPSAGSLAGIWILILPIQCQISTANFSVFMTETWRSWWAYKPFCKIFAAGCIELVVRVRAQRLLFIPMFGVPATFGLLWKVCGNPVARLWDKRTETTEMGFLSHKNSWCVNAQTKQSLELLWRGFRWGPKKHKKVRSLKRKQRSLRRIWGKTEHSLLTEMWALHEGR